MKQVKTWSFLWIGGGYNSVRAPDRETALKLAKELGAPHTYAPGKLTVRLVPDESTLSDDMAQLNRLDAMYQGCMD